jgi:outer membrane protein TolC
MLAAMAPAPQNISAWKDALALVKARSTDLRIALLEVERAEAQSRIALASLLPTINGNVTGTHNILRETTQSPQLVFIPVTSVLPPGTPLPGSIPPDTIVTGGSAANASASTAPIANLATGSLTVIQPLVNVRAWHAYDTAREAEKVARLSLEDVQRNIALGVANAIVGVVTAERIAELNRVGFRSALERLDLTRRKRILGAANGLDVVRAQQDVESARATLVTGDEALRQAREALGLALGTPHQIGVSKGINLDGLEQEALRSCKATSSLEQRSDIAAARQRVHVASRNYDNVKLQFLPVLNAQSALATTTAPTAPLPTTTWNIQAILTIPLWEGGARYGQLRDTRAQEYEAEMNLEALRRTASVQLEQARRNVDVTEQSRKVAADARALSAETDRLVRTGYMEGQGTSLELVTAAAQLRQAEINLALKEFDVVRARVLAVLSLATCPW